MQRWLSSDQNVRVATNLLHENLPFKLACCLKNSELNVNKISPSWATWEPRKAQLSWGGGGGVETSMNDHIRFLQIFLSSDSAMSNSATVMPKYETFIGYFNEDNILLVLLFNQDQLVPGEYKHKYTKLTYLSHPKVVHSANVHCLKKISPWWLYDQFSEQSKFQHNGTLLLL